MSLKIIKKMGEANVTAPRHFIAATFHRHDILSPQHFIATTFYRRNILSTDTFLQTCFRKCWSDFKYISREY
jgi:hypothetical protein